MGVNIFISTSLDIIKFKDTDWVIKTWFARPTIPQSSVPDGHPFSCLSQRALSKCHTTRSMITGRWAKQSGRSHRRMPRRMLPSSSSNKMEIMQTRPRRHHLTVESIDLRQVQERQMYQWNIDQERRSIAEASSWWRREECGWIIC